MLRRVREFWTDESGAVGIEWAFVASILVLGSVVGLLAVRAELFGRGSDRTQDVRPSTTPSR